jgi:S-adenosylmethionine:tRNA-ribosyltransferase-isomerase (queuine synthetase)
MKLSHFQFDLPKELLAEYPSENRDEASNGDWSQKTNNWT